jgi:membrane protease YdiL (CAAX protease family)
LTSTGTSGRRLLLAVLLWLVIGAVVDGATLLAFRVLAGTWVASHRAGLSAVLIAEAYVSLLTALLLAFGGLAGLRDRLGFRFTSAADIGGALLVWIGALVAGGIVTAALAPLIGEPPSNAVSILRRSFDPLFVAVIVPTICLLAPISEELLFRGALFGWLRSLLPSSAAIVITAALFAGAHLLPTLFPVLFVFGLGATWVRERTGSTLNSFAMHATQNTFAVVATYALLSQGS